MGEYFFHYTSRHLAQEIIISGWLKPGRGGRLYLTGDSFERGADAANRLAILRMPVEVACVIPKDKVEDCSEERHVHSILGSDGIEIRQGCGREQYTTKSINIEGLPWLTLLVP
jgi:hypothetical protein